MTFFNASEPLIRNKQEELDIQDLRGLLRIDWRIGKFQLLSRLYTRIDQIFVLWGWISVVIFAVAQFFPISWQLQAIIWSGLTVLGTVVMTILAWFWVQVEQLRWVVYAWAVLMLTGIVLTDCGIFLGWGWILVHLCQLWLGLSAVGYFLTGWGLHSRTFVLAGVIHCLGILLLPYSQSLPFLYTGTIIAGTLLFLAEVQWDMRPPIDSEFLTAEELQFNCQQHQRRKAEN
ncbi:MAG: hypothetical protein SWJ54_00360 [Cyanobacteriota bacterium]|nr:hypothetical protein [Cyanobacteriota bacterium]